MEKLLELSKEIDSSELYPLVVDFSNVAKEGGNIEDVYEKLNIAKQKTRKLDLLIFLTALIEAIAIFNDFSSLEIQIKKEMLQGCRESTQFYLNRILKEAKEKNELLKIQWAKELEEILKGCQGGNVGGSQLKTKSSSDQNQQQPIQKNNSIQQQKNLISKKPKIELVGNVWYVENQTGNMDIEIIAAEMQQRIAIINCCESLIKIKGKCTAVSVEQTNKLGVIVQDVIVSTFELLNSNKTQIQLNSTCPTMTIDNSEGIQIFLSAGVADKFELLTCKSNEINLYRQSAAGEDFSDEIPVPEQFKSHFDENGNLKTVAVRHTGV